MAEIVHYTSCPVCGSNNLKPFLNCEDFTVSHKIFVLLQCAECNLAFTQDVPTQENIGPYYQSDAYISHTDTDTGLISKLYKTARKFTLKKKLQLVQKASGKMLGNILDIGAGTGAFLHAMKQANWQITGLEPDAGAREICQKKYHISLHEPSVLFLQKTESQDAITMWHVLEHVHDLHAYMQQISFILKKDGVACIAVPNYVSADAAHYKSNWAAYDVPRHLYHFCPTAINKLATLNGLKVEAIKPLWLDAFYISMLSQKYKNGNGNLLVSCWYGLLSNFKAMQNKESCSSLIYILKKQDAKN